jgi:competence ComEA-like helix-hairpin-helix protein
MSEGQGEERLEREVESPPPADQGATDEIMALEEDLERERERAARALDAVERRLEEVEAQAAGVASQTRREEGVREEARRSQREQELLERSRAELEARIRQELEGELSTRIEAVRSDADARAAEEIKAATKAAEDAQHRVDEIAAQIEDAGARVEQAEAKLVEERERLQREAEERLDTEMRRLHALRRQGREQWIAEKRAKRERERRLSMTHPPPAQDPPRERSSRLDVNSASFEELRGLGLSVTEATRVIAYRERRSGFDSIDEVAAVPGLPKEQLERLRESLTV